MGTQSVISTYANVYAADFKRSWAAILSPENRVPVEFPRVSIPVECRASQAEYRAAGGYLAVAFLVQRPSFVPFIR
jgi:hypothetical protein